MTVQTFAARRVLPAPPTIGRYAWYVGNLIDGRIVTEVPLVDTQWQLVMDDAGMLQGTAYLGDPDVRALDLWSSAAVARSFLAVAYQAADGTETFLEAGPIWRATYSASKRTLQLGAAGLWSYFDHRKVMPVLAGANPAQAVTTYNAVSLGTIAKRLLELAATHTGGSLPIVLPDDEAATDDTAHTRSYPGYELDQLGQMLRNLTTDHNGPELRFRPQRSDVDGYLEWVFETGTEADPTLHQAERFIWDATVDQGPVQDVDAVVDGSGIAGRAWVRGSGQEVATLISVEDDTTLTGVGYPLLEVDVPGSESVIEQDTLDQTATAALLPASGPAVTVTATVRRDDVPQVGTYRVGDDALIELVDHDYLPDGGYASRITQIRGDDTESVSVDLAPTLGSIVNG